MTSLLLAIIYIAFISLGLPDSLLGSAWPTMYQEFGVPVSWSGAVFMIINLGTVVSSLLSDRLTRMLGTGKVMVISVAMTALALFGFSVSSAYWMLILWAIPYGLGAGSVDASLNNYVALHYESRHMSWLHCMWGVGAAVGPYIMSAVLTGGSSWNMGYRTISIIQIVLTAILFISLPLWKSREEGLSREMTKAQEQIPASQTASPAETAENSGRRTSREGDAGKPLSIMDIIRLPGAKEIMLCFFCYSAIEQSSNLWASSYLNLARGVSAETAAAFASMFFIGITIGRGVSGFITMKLNDTQMVRLGEIIVAVGIAALAIPGPTLLALAGFILIGLGCAPIYPSLIHSTPAHFGAYRSQAVIGVQMASAYVGTSFMPPLFGIIAGRLSVRVLPVFMLIFLLLMVFMHEQMQRKASGRQHG